jgi:hypothetical protein
VRFNAAAAVCAVSALASVGLSGHPPFGLYPAGWPAIGCNPQHWAQSGAAAQPLTRIKWQAPVDLNPQYSGNILYIHYGSPMVTPANTVVFPVKTGANDGFRVEGRTAAAGTLVWSMDTDYSVPPHDWFPPCGATLTRQGRVVVAGAGGTILERASGDAASATVTRYAFFGINAYNANPAAYNSTVIINTPITADENGTVYFGFIVTGSNPSNLSSGIARVAADGTGSWTPVTVAAADPNAAQVPHNCAPALSFTSKSVYIAVRDGGSGGWLTRLDSQTLAPQGQIRCHDPNTGYDAYVDDDGTPCPTVGPDGDVYYGVLENGFGSNHLRGWMLHFNSTLTQVKTPGAFGWDDTASVVPRDAVPSYTGPSPYLLLTKYNNYVEGGGDGNNKVAVLDPNQTEIDPVTGATVMREIMTQSGPTPDSRFPGNPVAVREWCINTAAVDQRGRCGMVNSEDGKLYRWDFVSNTLSQVVTLTPGIGEAYTPTCIGPDGTVYAINNATLFACGN